MPAPRSDEHELGLLLSLHLSFMAQRCLSVQEGLGRRSPPVQVPELGVASIPPAPTAPGGPGDANSFAACVTNLQLWGGGRKTSIHCLKPG